MANDMRFAFETNVIGELGLYSGLPDLTLMYAIIGVTQTISCFLPLLRAGNHKKVISLSSGIGDEEFTTLVTLFYPAVSILIFVSAHADLLHKGLILSRNTHSISLCSNMRSR